MALIIPEAPKQSEDPSDKRMLSLAASRNVKPIADWLVKSASIKGDALEIASGTGEHIIEFARRMPEVNWYPTDISFERLESIRAWISWSNQDNIADPKILDIINDDIRSSRRKYSSVFCANLFHLITCSQSKSALRNMVNLCEPNGTVNIYGPFRRENRYASQADRDFDEKLRRQDASIGIKSITDFVKFISRDLDILSEITEMPANNILLTIFPK